MEEKNQEVDTNKTEGKTGPGPEYERVSKRYGHWEYVGQLKYDKQNGQGTFTWADGKKYVGELKYDKKKMGKG